MQISVIHDGKKYLYSQDDSSVYSWKDVDNVAAPEKIINRLFDIARDKGVDMSLFNSNVIAKIAELKKKKEENNLKHRQKNKFSKKNSIKLFGDIKTGGAHERRGDD